MAIVVPDSLEPGSNKILRSELAIRSNSRLTASQTEQNRATDKDDSKVHLPLDVAITPNLP